MGILLLISCRSHWFSWRACARLAALVVITLICGLGCGYRPVGSASANLDVARPVYVPAFVSYIGYPELDVYAADVLASRLATYGLVAGDDVSATRIEGTLARLSERPQALLPEQTLLELCVEVHIAVSPGPEDSSDGDVVCQTRTAIGRARLSVVAGRFSETERQTALRSAIASAIDELSLDVLACVAGRED